MFVIKIWILDCFGTITTILKFGAKPFLSSIYFYTDLIIQTNQQLAEIQRMQCHSA